MSVSMSALTKVISEKGAQATEELERPPAVQKAEVRELVGRICNGALEDGDLMLKLPIVFLELVDTGGLVKHM